jgi:tungstate transport system permease protein
MNGDSFLTEAFREAFDLLLGGDAVLGRIALRSVLVSLSATGLATLVGIPIGFSIALGRFRGRRVLITILNTLLSLPTVVVGLAGYGLLTRSGPFGYLDLLYTKSAIVLGQAVLAAPIVTAFTLSAVSRVDPRIQKTAYSLGAGRLLAARAVFHEARFGILASVIAAFGRVTSEVGIAMILGGNIAGDTRTMTTAMALEHDKGDFALGLALGLILLIMSLSINVLFRYLQGEDHRT